MMERQSFLFAACLAFAVAPAFARRPLNWRMHRQARAPEASSATAVGAAPAPASAGARLMAGRWRVPVRAALEGLIASAGSASPGYDPTRPPVAVFPWSDAAVDGDPAELVFLHLVTDARFRADDAWWRIVPVGYGRQAARAAYEQFVSLSTAVWTAQPGYHAWRKGMLSSYLSLCREVGRKTCRSYLARLWAGWRDDEAEEYARAALDEEKRRAGTTEPISGQDGDAAPLRARRGLRAIPEMRDLVAKLRRAGFDVWVIDDVPQPVLEVSAADYGVDPSRVYGVRNSTDGPRIGAGMVEPMPTRGGKTAVLLSSVGRPADLVFGRDAADTDVLAYGDGLRVVFDSDPKLVQEARVRRWLIQPAFAH